MSQKNYLAESERQITLDLDKIEVFWSLNMRNNGEEISPEDPKVIEIRESIREVGLLENLVVAEKLEKEKGETGTFRYILTAGFRRYVALKALGFKKVKVRCTDWDEKMNLIVNGIENLVREDCTKYDQAVRFTELKRKFGMTGKEISLRFKMGKSTVDNLVRVAENLAPELLVRWRRNDEAYEDFKKLVTLPHDEQLVRYDELLDIRKQREIDAAAPEAEDEEEEDPTPAEKVPRMRPRLQVEKLLQYDLKKAEEIKIPGQGWLTITDDEKKVAATILRYVLNAKSKPVLRTLAVEEDDEAAE